MANRTGIELLPDVCRVIAVQASTDWLGRSRARAGGSRVTAFHEIPYSPENPGACAVELRRALGGRNRQIRMAVWGLRSTHQVLYLPNAAPSEQATMARREARAKGGGAAAGGPDADGIMVGQHREGGRTEVGYIAGTPAEIESRVQAFVDAGLVVTSVVTPAVAHAMLVRQRWGQGSESGTTVMSVNARATAMTVVRGGVVVFARELPWGHQTDRLERGSAFDATAFAGQVASEVRRSLVFLKQQFKLDVGHVLVCGDLPDLRALTAPLMHELNVEVETVDSLEGFDVAHLPEPADEFRSRIGAYRTAWALAADAAPGVNLMPRIATSVRIDPQTRSRVGWGVAAGVLVAAAGWGASELLARSARTGADGLRRQVAVLEPEAQRQAESRRIAGLVAARAAALSAFDTQGPRVARILEVLASNSSADVAVTAVALNSTAASWQLKVEGQAEGQSAQDAQAHFNAFMNAIKSSSLLGDPTGTPSVRLKTQQPPEPVVPPEATAEPEASQARESRPSDIARQVPKGSGYLDIARDGHVYRIPIRRNEPVPVADPERWRLRYGNPEDFRATGQSSAGSRQATVATGPRGSWSTAPVRFALSLLDFALEFEVRK